MATSAPVPIAIPRSAWARAAASLMPSPAIATTWPCSCSSATLAALSAGSTSARTRVIPTCAATAWAVAALSPVIIHTSRPSASSWAMASADSGLTVSATVMTPAAWPSTATYIGVAPLCGRRLRDGGQLGDVHGSAAHHLQVADQQSVAGDARLESVAGYRVEGLQRRQGQSGRARVVDDGLSHRVLAAGLRCRDQGEDLGLVPGPHGGDTGEGGTALGDGAGLVQHHGSEPLCLLERLAVRDQDAELGCAAGSDHDCGRRGQAESARAGDDQHRDGGGDRHGQVLGVRAEHRPEHERR